MEKSRLETKVGLFVLIGLVLLAVLMIQFSKGTSLWRGTYNLKLVTRNVGGLKVKSGVLLSGVQVGTVKRIELNPGGTNVTILLEIYRNFPIYHDARFVIEQSGFLGDQFVSVIPTTNAPPILSDGAEVKCQEPFNLQEVARSAAGFIQRIDETAKKLDASVTDLRAQVLNTETLTNFGASIKNLKLFTDQALDTVRNVNGVVNTNAAQISCAISNAAVFSARLLRLENSAGDILATNGGNINQATKNLAETSATFKRLAADLQAGKGLAGAVLQNPELATNVQAIAANLAVTSSNLNRIGLWGILWSHEPPDTNATTRTTTPRSKPPRQ